MEHAEAALEPLDPIGEDDLRIDAVGDAEREVDVRPAVLGTARRGASQRAAADPRVGAREREHALPHPACGPQA